MSRKPDARQIGIFVVGAVVLIVAGLVIFGTGRLFVKTDQYVGYFEGSLSGLGAGSAVQFRGIHIGQVTDVIATFHPQTLAIEVEVLFEIERGRVQPQVPLEPTEEYKEAARRVETLEQRGLIDLLIRNGLRATLETQSVITGQRYIQLAFHPDTPAQLSGFEHEYQEIPTIPTPMQELQQTLRETMQSLAQLPAEMSAALDQLKQTLSKANRLLESEGLPATIASIREAMDALAVTAADLDAQISPMTAEVTQTARTTRKTLAQADSTLADIELIAEESSVTQQELQNALKSFAEATNAVRLLAEYLERHPEALVSGKNASGGK